VTKTEGICPALEFPCQCIDGIAIACRPDGHRVRLPYGSRRRALGDYASTKVRATVPHFDFNMV
jgi:hypothetical protein